MLKFDDRFARQDRCEPPPEFPLASPCSSIVHHLSGLSARALAPRRLAPSRCRGPVLRRRQGRRITPRSRSLRHWGSVGPSTRARAQLLGPCFKTGRSECREPRGQKPSAHTRGRPAVPSGRALDQSARQSGNAARRPAGCRPAPPHGAAECAARAPRPLGLATRTPGL